jgi:hypothetical protein
VGFLCVVRLRRERDTFVSVGGFEKSKGIVGSTGLFGESSSNGSLHRVLLLYSIKEDGCSRRCLGGSGEAEVNLSLRKLLVVLCRRRSHLATEPLRFEEKRRRPG